MELETETSLGCKGFNNLDKKTENEEISNNIGLGKIVYV